MLTTYKEPSGAMSNETFGPAGRKNEAVCRALRNDGKLTDSILSEIESRPIAGFSPRAQPTHLSPSHLWTRICL